MGGGERQNRPSSTVLKPPSQAAPVSSTGEPPVARVTLPSNLSGSLKYLDDAQLQRLLEAVTVEIDRRNHGAAKNKGATAGVGGTSTKDQSVPTSNEKNRASDKIPEGKANLIRASFRAGMKPAAIARTFRISQSLVSRILDSAEKPKR
jgi:hypothetical protein